MEKNDKNFHGHETKLSSPQKYSGSPSDKASKELTVGQAPRQTLGLGHDFHLIPNHTTILLVASVDFSGKGCKFLPCYPGQELE